MAIRFVSSIRGVLIFLPSAANIGLTANAAADDINSFLVILILTSFLQTVEFRSDLFSTVWRFYFIRFSARRM